MELQGVSFTSFSFVIRFWVLGAQMKFKICLVQKLDHTLKYGFCKKSLLNYE